MSPDYNSENFACRFRLVSRKPLFREVRSRALRLVVKGRYHSGRSKTVLFRWQSRTAIKDAIWHAVRIRKGGSGLDKGKSSAETGDTGLSNGLVAPSVVCKMPIGKGHFRCSLFRRLNFKRERNTRLSSTRMVSIKQAGWIVITLRNPLGWLASYQRC